MNRQERAALNGLSMFDQRQHQGDIAYAQRAAQQDVEWRYPMASNRFDDRAQQQAYEARYRALTGRKQ